MLPRKDMVRLQHMVDASAHVIAFARGRTQQDLVDDIQFPFAVHRGLEIIGEAAAQVSEETRKLLPQLPWPQIVGTRNRLIHACFDVEPRLVWETITRDLPALSRILIAFLSEHGEQASGPHKV